MHNKNLILACLAMAICAVSGQGLDNNDVPPECQSVCQPVVDTERRCDTQFDDDGGDDNISNPQGVSGNQVYRDCVCQDQNASQALGQCFECTTRYPNFFIDRDNDNDDGPGPDFDDNEIAEWAQICGLSTVVNGTNGSTGTLTAAPTSRPTLTTSSRTVTQTYDCDNPPDNDVDDILDDVNDRPDTDDNDPQCTRTTVVPVVGIATGAPGPLTSGATRTGPAPTGVSISYSTSTGTDAAGNVATFTSAVSTFTGAAALPTAAAGYFGAGAAALLAAFAL